jgi:hypothetical protein
VQNIFKAVFLAMGLSNSLIAGGFQATVFQELSAVESKTMHHAKLQADLLVWNVFCCGDALENAIVAWRNLNRFEVVNDLPLTSKEDQFYSPQVIYKNMRLGVVGEFDRNNPFRVEALFELQERFCVVGDGCGVRPRALFEITPSLVQASYATTLKIEKNPERIIELYERWDKFAKQYPSNVPIFFLCKSLADFLPKYQAAKRAVKTDS